MARTYWIGVAARQHVEMGMAGGFCMFAHGAGTAAQKLKPGDLFTYYAPMGGMGTGGQVRAFVAIGEVLDAPAEERQMAPGVSGWQRKVRYFPAEQASIYPLLAQLSFIKDQAHWGVYFRKSLFKASEADFAVIAGAMRANQALALIGDKA